MWVPVPGFDYEVSDDWQVRRTSGGRGARAGRLLRTRPHAAGYRIVELWRDNRKRTFLVHDLMALAFWGRVPERGRTEVNHRDGVRHHNALDNLEWATRRRNLDHAMSAGLLDNRGERNAQARLTAAQVSEIRARYRPGGNPGYKALAHEFGVSWEAIRKIVKRANWTHLRDDDVHR